MSDHTQAPWTISPVRTVDGEYMVVGGPGKEFGLIAAVTEETDAHLIAAAPKMHDALRAIEMACRNDFLTHEERVAAIQIIARKMIGPLSGQGLDSADKFGGRV